jgi:hypothetical protein
VVVLLEWISISLVKQRGGWQAQKKLDPHLFGCSEPLTWPEEGFSLPSSRHLQRLRPIHDLQCRGGFCTVPGGLKLDKSQCHAVANRHRNRYVLHPYA